MQSNRSIFSRKFIVITVIAVVVIALATTFVMSIVIPKTQSADANKTPVLNSSFLTSNQVVFTWEPFNSGSEYQLECSLSNAFEDVISTNSMTQSAACSGLEPGTLYYARVKEGEGEWSAATEVRTAKLVAVPTNLTIQTLDQTGITLTWDEVSGTSTYELQYSPDDLFSDDTTTLTASENSVKVEAFESETTYYFRVRVQQTGVFGSLAPYSEPVSAMTLAD